MYKLAGREQEKLFDSLLYGRAGEVYLLKIARLLQAA
jgi:hypothetical protein